MKKITLLFLLIFIGYCYNASAQEKPRFWDDVQTIKGYDKMFAPPDNPILFIGSSSIRKWEDLERTFASYVVMNRGIGGTVTNDITFYANDMIFPYKPRQIFIYVGENDLPNEAATSDSILHWTKRLIDTIRVKMPEVPIVYISLKPSPSREKYLEKAKATNTLIRNYIKTEKNIRYLDVFTSMLTKDGKLRPELFVGDMLHMNKKGYQIWTDLVKPYLLKK